MRVSRRESLDRYYLLSFRGFGLFLHRIKKADPEDTLHSHPWDGVSLILGAYQETKVGEAPRWKVGLNLLKGDVPHRVSLPFGPVWTLFLHGRRYNQWGVFDLEGNLLEAEPWRGVEDESRTSYRKPG